MNKVALITGAKRIGATVAAELADRGCDVVLTYLHSKSEAEKTAKIVESKNRKSLLLKMDLTSEKSIGKGIKKFKSKFKRLDILINMASTFSPTALKTLNEKKWDKHVDSNLKSTYLMMIQTQEMLKKAKGRIINISDWTSASGRPRYKDFVPYYVAKAGVIGLTEAMALELAPHVLVNAIAPGPILAPKNMRNEETKNIRKVTPLKKWGGPQEIAKAVRFLIDSDFVTGECIRVDGGRHLF